MSEAIVVTAVFRPRVGAFDEVHEVLARAVAEVHTEPGCLLYAIHRDPEDQIVMIEKWASVADLDDHGRGEAVRRLDAAVTGLLNAPPVVTRLVPLPAGTTDQGRL